MQDMDAVGRKAYCSIDSGRGSRRQAAAPCTDPSATATPDAQNGWFRAMTGHSFHCAQNELDEVTPTAHEVGASPLWCFDQMLHTTARRTHSGSVAGVPATAQPGNAAADAPATIPRVLAAGSGVEDLDFLKQRVDDLEQQVGAGCATARGCRA